MHCDRLRVDATILSERGDARKEARERRLASTGRPPGGLLGWIVAPHLTTLSLLACGMLSGCYLVSDRDAAGGDSSTAGQGGGALSPEPVDPCPAPLAYALVAPSSCEGGPDPYLREVATCFSCDDTVIQVRVGNGGDAAISLGFDVEVSSAEGDVRTYGFDELLPPGELSGIYAVGRVGDVSVRVLPRGDDCEPANNVLDVDSPSAACP